MVKEVLTMVVAGLDKMDRLGMIKRLTWTCVGISYLWVALSASS